MTQDNAPFFVPFNQTQAPFGSDARKVLELRQQQQAFGVTDQQRDDAYAQWLQGMLLLRFREAVFLIAFLSHAAGLQDGLQGMFQYQVRH